MHLYNIINDTQRKCVCFKYHTALAYRSIHSQKVQRNFGCNISAYCSLNELSIKAYSLLKEDTTDDLVVNKEIAPVGKDEVSMILLNSRNIELIQM